MALTVYGYEKNPRTQFVLIVAAAEGIDAQLSVITPWSSEGKDEFIAKFPLSGGKIPALEWADIKLTETLALAMYLAKRSNKTHLVGNGTLEEEALVISWMSWANSELGPALAAWYIPILPESALPKGYKAKDPDFSVIRSSQATSFRLLDTLEDHLRARKFIVGEHLTLADLIVTVVITRGLQWVLDARWRGEHVNIIRHFDMVSRLESFKSVIPEVILVEKALRIYDPDEMVSY